MMSVVALGMAVLSVFVLINSRVRARGFARGELVIDRIQPWTDSGSSTATTTRTYKVHGVVTTPKGSFSATSIDLYDEDVLSKKGKRVPCRYDPDNPSRITLDLTDHSGIDLQDVVLAGFAILCLAIAWFAR